MAAALHPDARRSAKVSAKQLARTIGVKTVGPCAPEVSQIDTLATRSAGPHHRSGCAARCRSTWSARSSRCVLPRIYQRWRAGFWSRSNLTRCASSSQHSAANLACDGLLSENFALIGSAMDPLTTESFRERMTADIKRFHTRQEFDGEVWDKLVSRFLPVRARRGSTSPCSRSRGEVKKLDLEYGCGDNILFYLATAPRFFGLIGDNLFRRGSETAPAGGASSSRSCSAARTSTQRGSSTRRCSRTGRERDLSGRPLSGEGDRSGTSSRSASRTGMFEPLWNKNYIDNIQFNVAEAVDVEARGGYYDSRSGVLRDMLQNHMFQMLAYLCMEVPGSFESDAICNEKAKLLQSVRHYSPEEVARYGVRGQYGPSIDDAGNVIKPGYRQEKDVSCTVADRDVRRCPAARRQLALEGADLPALGKGAVEARHRDHRRVQEGAGGASSRGTPVASLGANRLVFHIQPHQGIEVQFHAKVPGPRLHLQPVHMRFYGDAFKAARYTGYGEVMLHCVARRCDALLSRRPGRSGVASLSPSWTTGRRLPRSSREPTCAGQLGPS